MAGWALPFVVVGLLFNPIAPVHLAKENWRWVDVLAGVVLLVGAAVVWQAATIKRRRSKAAFEAYKNSFGQPPPFPKHLADRPTESLTDDELLEISGDLPLINMMKQDLEDMRAARKAMEVKIASAQQDTRNPDDDREADYEDDELLQRLESEGGGEEVPPPLDESSTATHHKGAPSGMSPEQQAIANRIADRLEERGRALRAAARAPEKSGSENADGGAQDRRTQ